MKDTDRPTDVKEKYEKKFKKQTFKFIVKPAVKDGILPTKPVALLNKVAVPPSAIPKEKADTLDKVSTRFGTFFIIRIIYT